MKIDTNGKIPIPPDIQNKLGLRPGTEVQIEVVEDVLQISNPHNSSRGKKLIASIRGKATKSITTNEIMQLTRKYP